MHWPSNLGFTFSFFEKSVKYVIYVMLYILQIESYNLLIIFGFKIVTYEMILIDKLSAATSFKGMELSSDPS